MIVVADDITGAAEIAGIAFAHGQQVRLVCGCSTATPALPAATPTLPTANPAPSTATTTVIATDTRSMSEAMAVAETRRVAALLPPGPGPLFKKTDSALRGHVVAELTTLMQLTGYRRAVYLPANPSKGRIIRKGTYYIGGKPLHETDFSFDPEFPARTSVLRERFPDAEEKGILMPDAETTDDIARIVRHYNDGETLFAGAADLFAAVLKTSPASAQGQGGTAQKPTADTPLPRQAEGEGSTFNKSTLILCGSTQSRPLDLGIPIAPMPREVYDGSSDFRAWDTTAYDAAHNYSLILTIPHTHRTGKDVAVHLRTVMAETAKRLCTRHRPDRLIIEGGATAWATLQSLGWMQFDIVRQIAPGVVQMRADNGTLVTLKPGSYPWGSFA